MEVSEELISTVTGRLHEELAERHAFPSRLPTVTVDLKAGSVEWQMDGQASN